MKHDGSPIKVLHLFDFYLPETMNWAHNLLTHTPSVEQWIAAPWMLKNRFMKSGFKGFTSPLQRLTGIMPESEWQWKLLSTNLIRLEYRFPFYRKWLHHRLKEQPPDLIHAHFGPVGCHHLALARQLGCPLLVSFYGYDFKKVPFTRPVYQKKYAALFREAEAILLTGPFTPEYLREQGCPKEKIHPLPLGISPETFPFKLRYKNSGELKLLQLATITRKKGHLDSLKALRKIIDRCPNIHLTIAGEKQDLQLHREIMEFIAASGLARHVCCLDAVSHDQLPAFLGGFEVFIHPSCETPDHDTEGSPVVILEAQSTGMPVIATFHADIPAQVMQGRSGLLSPASDADALAASIERFYFMENNEYQLFSQAASRMIGERFDVKKSGASLSNIYLSLL